MKCGTTILYDYLCANPLINGYPGKEAHYFSLEYETTSFSEYQSKFSSGEDRVLCDASPTYFDCSLRMPAMERIKAHLPNSIVIVLIRDPVERALSHFNHMKNINKIDLLQGVSPNDFFSRFDQVEDSIYTEYLIDAISFSFYCDKIVKLFNLFDPNRVVVFDNSLIANQATDAMRLIYSRLGTDFYHSAVYGHRDYMSGTDLSCIDARLRNNLNNYFEVDYQKSIDLCTKITKHA